MALEKYGRVHFAIPHFLAPTLNSSIESGTQTEPIQNFVLDYKSMPYKNTLPVPLNDPIILKGKAVAGIDHVTKVVNDTIFWENEKNDLILRNLKLGNSLFIKSDKVIKNWKSISKETVRLAEHIDSNPDPAFSGFYNWYYTDGCLNNIFHNNATSLLYANDSLPGKCIVTPVDIKNLECSLLKDRSVFLNTGHKQRIFQISVNNNFVAIRQKNFTSLFTITSDNELAFKKIHNHSETKNSILSVSISNDLDGEYCTLTASRKLKLWSPEVKNECITCVDIEKNETGDCWGSVKYVSNNNILVSNRAYVYLKDTRIGLRENVQKWKAQIKEVSCDFISMLMKSRVQDNCAYVGTTHNLYELDFRNGLSKQWTHMMEFPPMYGASNLEYNVNETLFIGSQSLNEVCAIKCDLHVMPYILPSPDETLSEVNLQGLCLDPAVACRFNLSMIGLTTVTNSDRNNSAFVFRTNSIGDIFYQNAIHKDDCNNDLSQCNINLKLFSKWEAKCEKSVDSLRVADVIDFDKLNSINKLELLSFRPNEARVPIKQDKKRKSSKSDNLFSRIRKRTMYEPIDNFSQSLVSVWDIETVDNEKSSDSKQQFHTFNRLKTEEKIVNQSSLAPKDSFQEQSNLESSRISYQNTVSQSIGSETEMDYESLLNKNEVHYEVSSNCGTSNLLTPKRISRNEVKKIVKKKSRFSSGF